MKEYIVFRKNDHQLGISLPIEHEHELERNVFDQFEPNDLPHSNYSHPPYSSVKRTIDIVVVLLVTPAALIVVAAAALAILVFMGSPVFFTQEREGLHGRVFKMFKLRTMRRADRNVKGATATVANNPKIPPLGRFLRRSHIDELPQVWITTLMGARPEQVHLVELHGYAYPSFYVPKNRLVTALAVSFCGYVIASFAAFIGAPIYLTVILCGITGAATGITAVES